MSRTMDERDVLALMWPGDLGGSIVELIRDRDQPWRHQAACRGRGTDIFFVERGESTTPAQSVCATCPVRDECRAYAHKHRIECGVWGGESARTRLRGTHPPAEPTVTEATRGGATFEVLRAIRRKRAATAPTNRRELLRLARQQRIVKLRAEGNSIPVIAAALGTARRTVAQALRDLEDQGLAVIPERVVGRKGVSYPFGPDANKERNERILELHRQGKTQAAIAAAVGVPQKTVHRLVRRVPRDLEARTDLR